MLRRQVWAQNFCLVPAEAGAQRGTEKPGEDEVLVRWRTAAEGFPASLLMVAPPYDADHALKPHCTRAPPLADARRREEYGALEAARTRETGKAFATECRRRAGIEGTLS